MKASQNAVNLIKQFEGFRPMAYRDAVNILTIGYGTVRNVMEGMVINEDQAHQMLVEDLNQFEQCINNYVYVEMTQNQFDALCVFVYNVGPGNFKKSTLLKKLNEGDYAGAAEEFMRWNKAGGKVLNGLTKRRAAEKKLFLS